jgi:hypothetical protein
VNCPYRTDRGAGYALLLHFCRGLISFRSNQQQPTATVEAQRCTSHKKNTIGYISIRCSLSFRVPSLAIPIQPMGATWPCMTLHQTLACAGRLQQTKADRDEGLVAEVTGCKSIVTTHRACSHSSVRSQGEPSTRGEVKEEATQNSLVFLITLRGWPWRPWQLVPSPRFLAFLRCGAYRFYARHDPTKWSVRSSFVLDLSSRTDLISFLTWTSHFPFPMIPGSRRYRPVTWNRPLGRSPWPRLVPTLATIDSVIEGHEHQEA